MKSLKPQKLELTFEIEFDFKFPSFETRVCGYGDALDEVFQRNGSVVVNPKVTAHTFVPNEQGALAS